MSEASDTAITTKEQAIVPFHSEYKSVMTLHRQMAEEIELRKLLTAFINHNMVDGIDYGKIHFSSKCENKYTPAKCKIAGHWSKPCLFKPGAEKFCSLFKYKIEYKKDQETWEMLGSRPGVIAYICFIIDQKGKVVGEGRGVSDVRDKGDNTGVKIAEKRAKIDAVLSTGGLSDFFTQDLEDMKPSEREAQESPVRSPEVAKPVSTHARITYRSKQEITRLCKTKGYNLAALNRYVQKAHGVRHYDMLTELQAKQVIIKLNSIPEKGAKKEETTSKEDTTASKTVSKPSNSLTQSDTIEKKTAEKTEEDQLAEEVL